MDRGTFAETRRHRRSLNVVAISDGNIILEQDNFEFRLRRQNERQQHIVSRQKPHVAPVRRSYLVHGDLVTVAVLQAILNLDVVFGVRQVDVDESADNA